MQPETGGRLDVRLIEHDERSASFQLELATPEGRWSGRAEVTVAEGRVEVGAWVGPGDPPDWLCQYLRAGLRAAWRQHATDGWPRRFTRWRDQRGERADDTRGAGNVDGGNPRDPALGSPFE